MICIVLEACYSGCLIPHLAGAADSVEIATAADKNSTSRSWTYITYVDKNGNNSYDRGTDSLVSTRIVNHYWDAFIDCLDSSRNWKQTHEWAVSQIDSSDSAHQKPQYGSHFKRVVTTGVHRVVVEDKTFMIGMPLTSPPETIDITLYNGVPLAAGMIPLRVTAGINGAFPLIDPAFPDLGFNPDLEPSIFEAVEAHPLDLDGNSPDSWFYQFDAVSPPLLDPGEYSLYQLPVPDILPIEGTFEIDTVFQPPELLLQLFDEDFFQLPVEFSPGDFSVIFRPNQLPEPQQVVLPLLPPPGDLYQIPLLAWDAEGDPLIFILEQGPPDGVITLGTGPFELWFQATMLVEPVFISIRIEDSPPPGSKRAPKSDEEYNAFEFMIPGTPPPCACDCQGDENCDGLPNVFDVVFCVAEAFRTEPYTPDPNPACPLVGMNDLNFDDAVNVFDVVFLVNMAFRNGARADNVCDPCTMVGPPSCPF